MIYFLMKYIPMILENIGAGNRILFYQYDPEVNKQQSANIEQESIKFRTVPKISCEITWKNYYFIESVCSKLHKTCEITLNKWQKNHYYVEGNRVQKWDK